MPNLTNFHQFLTVFDIILFNFGNISELCSDFLYSLFNNFMTSSGMRYNVVITNIYRSVCTIYYP